MVILTYGLLERSKILCPSEYTRRAVTMVIGTVLYLGGRTNKPGDSVKPNAGHVLYVNTSVKDIRNLSKDNYYRLHPSKP